MPNDNDTVNAWLDRLSQHYTRDIQLGLERLKPCLVQLGCAKYPCPVVTIAGTNGKGTTLAMLEQIYRNSGYRVGSLTSPHLLRFNERIRVDGSPISDQQLCERFNFVDSFCQQNKITLTLFEFVTLAGCYHFAQQKLDVLLLEVGLGGEYDAINAVDPDTAVITTIALDHQHLLGNTIEAIAKAKAGIMRAGKPVIIGDLNAQSHLLAHAGRQGAKPVCADRDFRIASISESSETWTWHCASRTLTDLPTPRIPLQNAATALAVVEANQVQLPVSETELRHALTTVCVPGRLQIISREPTVILDVAHNPESVSYLAQSLASRRANQSNKGRVFAVFSMLQDKQLSQCVQAIASLIDTWFVAPLEQARAATLTQLQAALDKATVRQANYYSHIDEAYQNAVNHSSKYDTILAFGSFYTVCSVMQQNGVTELYSTA